MNDEKKTLEFKFEREISAPASDVFDAWLNPEVPGTTWHEADKLILNPKVEGLFYWRFRPTGTPHFGRFTEVTRPSRIQYTWMSPNTLGKETTVTVTFKKQSGGTLMTLVHSGLPDHEKAKSHENGWNYFLDQFLKRLSDGAPGHDE